MVGHLERDDVPPVEHRARRRLLADDAAVQQRTPAVGIGPLAQQPEIVAAQPRLQRLPATEIRHRHFVQPSSPEVENTLINVLRKGLLPLAVELARQGPARFPHAVGTTGFDPDEQREDASAAELRPGRRFLVDDEQELTDDARPPQPSALAHETELLALDPRFHRVPAAEVRHLHLVHHRSPEAEATAPDRPAGSVGAQSAVPRGYRAGVITTPRRSRFAMLVALGVDNFGSGLFAPLTIMYVHSVIGLDIGTAGALLTVGALLGLAVPPLAGRLVDRFGARTVVIAAQLVQAAGAATFLVAGDAVGVLVAAALLGGGLQLFFCSLFTLILDVPVDGPVERQFALVGVVRGVPFGVGTLLGSVVLATGAFQVALLVNVATFLCCAALLATLVHTTRTPRQATGGYREVLRDRPYLSLLAINGLLALGIDVFLVGAAVYMVNVLQGPSWSPGVAITLNTVLGLVAAMAVVRLVRPLRRTTSLALSGLCTLAWAGAVCLTPLWAAGVQPWYFVVIATLLMLGNLIQAPVGIALVQAVAPAELRARYLALSQYSFTAAQLLAPGVVGLFALSPSAPWAVVAAAAALGAAAALRLRRRLPETTLISSA